MEVLREELVLELACFEKEAAGDFAPLSLPVIGISWTPEGM